jgi:hypothetical protein
MGEWGGEMDNAQELEVRFMGRIAAGFTHELKNVLAIVKETAGLMEDLLSMTPEGAFKHQPRFQKAVTTILEQVMRGVELSTRMNRFAHSPDHSTAQVDLNEVADQVCLLAERFARIKGVSLSTGLADNPVLILSCPVKVLLSVFKAYECCWTQLAAGGAVVATVSSEPQPSIAMTCTGEAEGGSGLQAAFEDAVEWQDLVQVMASVEGSVAWSEGTGFRLCFSSRTTAK